MDSLRNLDNFSKISNRAFGENATGKFSNLALKGMSRQNSNSLFGEKAAGKYFNFYFNGQSARKIQIPHLAGWRVANF